jgi:hypothetical protein
LFIGFFAIFSRRAFSFRKAYTTQAFDNRLSGEGLQGQGPQKEKFEDQDENRHERDHCNRERAAAAASTANEELNSSEHNERDLSVQLLGSETVENQDHCYPLSVANNEDDQGGDDSEHSQSGEDCECSLWSLP